MEKMIIYHIQIDRFSGNIPQSTTNEIKFMGGNIEGIINHLEYIKEMGFNTILLTPFLKSTNYHGYHIEDYYRVDEHFGPLEDIKALIDRAHHLNLKLIFDFVPNHCSYRHPYFLEAKEDMNSQYRSWLFFENGSYRKFFNFKELPKLNLHNPAVAHYLIEVCKYWVTIGFDHIRIDHAIGVPFEFLKKLRLEVRSINPNATIIGEVWGDGFPKEFYNNIELKNRALKIKRPLVQEELQLDYLDTLDGEFDFVFTKLVVNSLEIGVKCSENKRLQKQVKKHLGKYPEEFNLILMLDNHDLPRILHYCKGDKEMLLDALAFMIKQGRSFSIYYGTESLMDSPPTINENGEEVFNDLSYREPFEWYSPVLKEELKELILYARYMDMYF